MGECTVDTTGTAACSRRSMEASGASARYGTERRLGTWAGAVRALWSSSHALRVAMAVSRMSAPTPSGASSARSMWYLPRHHASTMVAARTVTPKRSRKHSDSSPTVAPQPTRAATSPSPCSTSAVPRRMHQKASAAVPAVQMTSPGKKTTGTSRDMKYSRISASDRRCDTHDSRMKSSECGNAAANASRRATTVSSRSFSSAGASRERNVALTSFKLRMNTSTTERATTFAGAGSSVSMPVSRSTSGDSMGVCSFVKALTEASVPPVTTRSPDASAGSSRYSTTSPGSYVRSRAERIRAATLSRPKSDSTGDSIATSTTAGDVGCAMCC
mmetsp:Transcript_51343/g.158254  ORF Transcript_51343/g.158254 Transcript_51343/m.158254 type:complete len:330 (-) Transcript_51343:210-1199(-)